MKSLLLSSQGLTYQAYPMPKRVDVTQRAAEYLFEPVHLDGVVRLRDIFQLFEACPTLRAVYRRSFIDEIMVEVVKGPKSKDREDEGERVEFLEIYRSWSLDTSTQTYDGTHALRMHGVGPALSRDYPEHYRKAGERIQWSLSLTPVRELLELPVRLNHEFVITEDNLDANGYGKEVAKARCETLMLGQLLAAVFDEIAFHGGPDGQQEVSAELQARMDTLDSAKTVSLDELFDGKDGNGGLMGRFERAGFKTMFETLGDVSKGALRNAMQAIGDDEPAAAALDKAFDGRVVVKPEYRELPGRAFRKAFRAA